MAKTQQYTVTITYYFKHYSEVRDKRITGTSAASVLRRLAFNRVIQVRDADAAFAYNINASAYARV